MKYTEKDKTTFTSQRCKLLDINKGESGYNFWKVNLEVSVHRSIGWHMINISKENIQIQVSDIPDVELTTVQTKRRTKLQARRCITTIAYKVLHQDFQKLYYSSMTYMSFVNLKPFYVSGSTEKETKMWLCSNSLIHIYSLGL